MIYKLLFGCDSSPISPNVRMSVHYNESNLAKMRESNLWKGFRISYQKVKQQGFWLWKHNGLHHEHCQAQPGQLPEFLTFKRFYTKSDLSPKQYLIHENTKPFSNVKNHETSRLSCPYQSFLVINVKMWKCLCQFADIMMSKCPCIAAISP